MLGGEAVVLLGDACTDALPYVRKQSGQLPSKMRFVSAQFLAMYGTDLWQRCAHNANTMAARLAAGARGIGIEIAFPVQANEVFALLPDADIPGLQERFHFYAWEEGRRRGSLARALGDVVGHAPPRTSTRSSRPSAVCDRSRYFAAPVTLKIDPP